MRSSTETIEAALAACFREFAQELPPETWIRCTTDGVDTDKDDAMKSFPQVFIQSGGKYQENEGTTWAVDVSVDAATWFEDDPNCQTRTAIYRDVERILDALIYPCATTSEVVAFFERQVRADLPGFNLGGATVSNGGLPFTSGGVQVISYSTTLHFTI